MSILNILNGCFLIASIIIIGKSLYEFKKNHAANMNLHQSDGITGKFTRKECIIFGIIIFISLIIRLWQYGIIPGGMNQDGAMAAVDAKALAEYGTDRYGMHMPVHFTAWGDSQMNVLMSYCMIPFFKIFGMSVITARLPILIVSMAGLIALYFVVRRLFGVRAAQIVLILASCNPWHFIQSRWALEANMFPHMFIIGLMFLLIGLEKKRRYVYLSMIFFALCMYSYGISFYTVPVFLLVVCIYILAKNVLKWSEVLISAGIYFFVSWPIYLTMMINAFKWNTIETPFCTMPYFPESRRSQDILFFAEDKFAQLIKNLHSLVRIFIRGDRLLWNTIEGFGVINICFVPFIFLGIYYVTHILRNESDAIKKTGYVSILTFFGIGILAGIITKEVNVNRINIIHYSLIILAGIGIFFVYKNHKKLSYVFLPMYLTLTILFLNTYFTSYADKIKGAFFDDFIKAVQYVQAETNCTSYVITPDTQYEGSTLVSEILTLFAQNIDIAYYQGKYEDENGLLYSEKYIYENAAQTDINANNPIAYVINEEELYLFSPDDPGDYVIQPFNWFYAIVPKNNMCNEQ